MMISNKGLFAAHSSLIHRRFHSIETTKSTDRIIDRDFELFPPLPTLRVLHTATLSGPTFIANIVTCSLIDMYFRTYQFDVQITMF